MFQRKRVRALSAPPHPGDRITSKSLRRIVLKPRGEGGGLPESEWHTVTVIIKL